MSSSRRRSAIMVCVLVCIALLAGAFTGTAYAAKKFGQYHERGFWHGTDLVNYGWRNGYDGRSYGALFNIYESWMWVKNTNRSVKAGAIVSHARVTIYVFGDPKVVEWGPVATNFFDNPAGNAIESHYYNELMKGDGFAWGYGKIRDPACNMHEIGTEENAIEIIG